MKTKNPIRQNFFVKSLAILSLCLYIAPTAVTAQDGDWSDGFVEAVHASNESEDTGGAGKPAPEIIDAESTMRLGTELSTQSLATAPYVYFDRLSRLGTGRLLKPKDRALYQQFDRITVKPIGAVSYRVGDTVDVLNIGRPVAVGGMAGRIITRTGRAVVLGAAGKRIVVQLTETWGSVEGGERIVKAASFTPVYTDKPVKPDVQIRGTVSVRVEDTATPYLQQYLIIDKGSADGVMMGDFFRVRERERSNRLSEDILEAQVINVAANSATLVVLKLHKHNLEVGDEAFLSMRAQ